MRAFRTSMPAGQRAELGERISFHLLEGKVFKDARTIHAYWPMLQEGEVDIRPVVLQAKKLDKVVWLPVVVDNTMHHRPFTSVSRLAPAGFGQLEPLDGPTLTRLVPDLIIAPGLSVDPQGNRLGYGGGFYDRYLASIRALPQAPLVLMVLYDGQVNEFVPHATHDIPVDAFITESGVTWCNTQRQSV